MHIIKKFLIVITILLTIYVIHRLLKNRKDILDNVNKTNFAASEGDLVNSSIEGYTSSSSSTADTRNNILLNYYVKSSYNSCLSGQSLSLDTLKSVLKRGYRFIDFEIAMINNTIQVCANSTYKDDTNQSSTNSISFEDALDTVKTVGLSYTTNSAPNYLEPLFIHLRIKMNGIDSSQQTSYYNSIAKIINTKLTNYLYPTITSNGRATDVKKLSLSNIISGNRKCFIVIDVTAIGYTYQSTNLKNVVHLTGGFNTGQVNYYSYDDAHAKENLYNSLLDSNGNIAAQVPASVNSAGNLSNVKNFSAVLSQGMYESPNYYPFDLVKNYSVQFATMNAALSDANLSIYESIFVTSSASSSTTGFITMARVLKLANTTPMPNNMVGDVKRAIVIGIFMLAAVGGFFMVTISNSNSLR